MTDPKKKVRPLTIEEQRRDEAFEHWRDNAGYYDEDPEADDE